MASENGRPSGAVLFSLLWSIVVPAVSGAVGATVWVFGVRDQALAAIERARQEEASARQRDLANYVTTTSFLEFRRVERERQDAQYYALRDAIRRVEVLLERGRR